MNKSRIDITKVLPEDCIAFVISKTSPRNACRSSLVSHAFQSAADSDGVWGGCLPSDLQEIISKSDQPSQRLLSTLSKKKLYFYLCHNPILINNGTMSFALEKENGKKRYMVGARSLSIAWGDAPSYWTWEHLPESRFSQVARLKEVWRLDVKGRIEARILSNHTTYAAYFVFKFANPTVGFDKNPVEMNVHFEGSTTSGTKRQAFLDPPKKIRQVVKDREDGWMEVEMAKFINESGDDGTILCGLKEVVHYKYGLIIQGIEFRPGLY
ncbi:hypothetical protein Tsubulata_025989 [Turnera subulata]|uniref:F-box domain-containing protein n=1 Tax=Turnera subulata TaxID=218843 RepID=A0A9Q0FKE9_9ROSI|nr:hypothetical protein Tsubulata_025989 [Turnera subulata]